MNEELRLKAQARITAVGSVMGSQLETLTDAMHKVLAEGIEDLKGDLPILELLRASIASNLETLVDIMRYDIAIQDVSSPPAAEEYARRLAQRGITSTALIRAYRLGQQVVLAWTFEEIARQEEDPQVAYAAAQAFTDLTFAYVDSISEQVVGEYEAEREKWLANRNTVRAAVLKELVEGVPVDVATAESALSYRLRQRHLGVLLWSSDPTTPTGGLRQLERLLQQLGKAAGAAGQPLFHPTDRSTAWAWIPLGRSQDELALGSLEAVLDKADTGLQAAVGTPAAGAPGFRITHLEAIRAQQVALAAKSSALRLTAFTDPGVRAAAMLASDLDGARRLVAKALGALAADTEGALRLRDTLMVFLAEKGSYTATAERIHLHKNTVKYRVDKAVEERGRPLDDERLELELALIAARWLGGAVLTQDGP
jgi:DNA-binding PucR family transcriptional regulator